jgi:oligosaccharide repeat unit polymerase
MFMILYWFLASVAAILAGSILLPTPDLLFGYVHDVMPAYLYIGLCSIAFVTGYFMIPIHGRARTAERTVFTESADAEIPTLYMMLFAALGISGVAILLLQIQATVGLSSYAPLVFDSAGDSTNILRYATVMLPSSEGGYPGYLKMFNWNSVIAQFCVFALIARGYRLRGFVSFTLAVVIATMYLGGTILRMDRLSLLALVPVLLSLVHAPGKRYRQFLAAGVILLLLAVISLQSARRVTETGMGMFDWAAQYLQLGTINLALLMRSPIHHTYGFSGMFSPFTWVAKSFGLSLLPETSSFDWSWSPAQGGFGYMFLDFGWLAVPVFLIFGSVARRIDERAISGAGGPWREVQWITAYAVASLPVVPAYNGIEFWLQLVMSVLLVRSVVNFVTGRQRFNRCYCSARSSVAVHAGGLPV